MNKNISETEYITKLMSSIAAVCWAHHPSEECDYVNDQGFLICGKCKTLREFDLEISEIPLKIMRVPIMCECRKEEYERYNVKGDWVKKQQIKRLKMESLMDESHKDIAFDNLIINKHNEKVFKLCKRYAEQFDRMVKKNQGLLLYGSIGTGKTYMAACVANYLINNSISCIMTTFTKILENLQILKNGENEQFIARLNKALLLIIDDLGAERSTDYALEKVYHIIDSRYRAKKPMILTTNLPLADMQKNTDIRYLRIYDRIFEVCYPVEFNGPSWRKSEAAKRHDEMREFWWNKES